MPIFGLVNFAGLFSFFLLTFVCRTADVSFNVGLIAPDGQFYYDTVSDGKIDEKIEVSQHGYYTLTIENTSDFDVTINGYVNY